MCLWVGAAASWLGRISTNRTFRAARQGPRSARPCRTPTTVANAAVLFDKFGDLAHNRFWRGVDLLDKGAEMLAVFRFQIEFLPRYIGNKFGILHGRVERIAQH